MPEECVREQLERCTQRPLPLDTHCHSRRLVGDTGGTDTRPFRLGHLIITGVDV